MLFSRLFSVNWIGGGIIDSNTMGATRLISKVDGVPQVDQLRPITLLNCDYKILSKILVLRMKPVMPSIIKSGQLCTVGKKNILFGVNNILSSVLYANQKNRNACLISLDFYKAYDRVYLAFLLEVLKKMGFGTIFCGWIKRLHYNAKTKFISEDLTAAIHVSFSIRQGDPIAMLLYIIYVEPLLSYIEAKISGLKIENFSQGSEAFCDDLNILTGNLTDLVAIDNAICKFESVSGAVLSRGNKCKIIGFGAWKDKVNWPLGYLQPVGEVKIFGFFITNSYQSMIKRNWNYRLVKVQQTLIAGSKRFLDSIYQRVEVINTFVLSRFFYIASVLPIPKNVRQQIEKNIGKFIWSCSGKLLRVSLNEVKLSKDRGGLGLLCLDVMGECLRLRQLLRLLENGDEKSLNHTLYWIGPILVDFLPDMRITSFSKVSPSIYNSLAEIFTDMRISEAFTTLNWNKVTNKQLYKHRTASFPSSKVEEDAGVSFKEIWRKLNLPVISSTAREVLYLAAHNKVPVSERLFRIGLQSDPYCLSCLEVRGALFGDTEHFFCTCKNVESTWCELRDILVACLDPALASISNLDLITLNFPKNANDLFCVWLIGNYMDIVWKTVYVQGVHLRKERVFGYLKFKYKADQLGARPHLPVDSPFSP